ncbi:MAG: phytanoyl-CoA dioxygenase family protein [Alphaproteobacteria bacterium]
MHDKEQRLTEIETVGYSIVPDFLDAETVAGARAELASALGSFKGRNNFEGRLTERVYACATRGPILMRIAMDPRMLELCDDVLKPGYLLSGSQGINIHPGETPQPFHADDSFYPLPRPRPMVSIGIMIAIDAFTSVNGSTEVIPGSHLWSDEEVNGIYPLGGNNPEGPSREPKMVHQAKTLILPAGGAMVFAGTLVHRGGANRSSQPRLAITNQYCEPWARTQENLYLSVPTELVRGLPVRMQELLGYSICPPFMGHVMGRHPLKTLEPDYISPVTRA